MTFKHPEGASGAFSLLHGGFEGRAYAARISIGDSELLWPPQLHEALQAALHQTKTANTPTGGVQATRVKQFKNHRGAVRFTKRYTCEIWCSRGRFVVHVPLSSSLWRQIPF